MEHSATEQQTNLPSSLELESAAQGGVASHSTLRFLLTKLFRLYTSRTEGAWLTLRTIQRSLTNQPAVEGSAPHTDVVRRETNTQQFPPQRLWLISLPRIRVRNGFVVQKLGAVYRSCSRVVATRIRTVFGRRQQHATAADIPIELYDLILHFLECSKVRDNHREEQEQRNRVAVGNRELGQLALVCRSWADICQKKLFSIVTLQSQQDFRELLSLASHPSSRISQYIERLQLLADTSATPWIHTVCMKVQPRSTSPPRPGAPFPNYQGHYLILIGVQAQDVIKKGLHASLPRRPLPAAFAQNITMAAIIGLEVSGLDEVVRLGNELPSLEALDLWMLKWTATPNIEAETFTALTRRRALKRRVPVKQMLMFECTEAWFELPLLCLWDSARSLSGVELAAIAALTQSIIVSVENAGHAKPMTWATREDWGYTFTVRTGWERIRAPLLSYVTLKDPEVDSWRLDIITLQFVSFSDTPMSPLSEMAGYDWKGFDQHAASLGALRCVVVGFLSRENLLFFAKEIEPKMPQLCELQKIRYALLDIDTSKTPILGWVTCSRPADDADRDLSTAKRVNCNELHKLGV